MTIQNVQQIAEIAKIISEKKAAGVPHTVERGHLLLLIDTEMAETERAEARLAALLDWESSPSYILGIEKIRVRSAIDAATRCVLREMETFIDSEFCPFLTPQDAVHEKVEKALDEQRRIIDAIFTRAAELKPSRQ